MQLMMPGVAVPNPEICPLIFFQPGKGDSLEIIHDAPLLFRRHRVVGISLRRYWQQFARVLAAEK